MPDTKNTQNENPDEALGLQSAAIALPQGSSITELLHELDHFEGLLGKDREAIGKLDAAVTALAAEQQYQTGKKDFLSEKPYFGIPGVDSQYGAIGEQLHSPSIADVVQERIAPRTGKAISKVTFPDKILLPDEIVIPPQANQEAAHYTDRQHDSGNTFGEYTPVVPAGPGPVDEAEDGENISQEPPQTAEQSRLDRAISFGRKHWQKAATHIAAFTLGAATAYALLSGDDHNVSISSPEEAVMHYNRVVGAAGGQLIVPMPPGMPTPEDICYEAFSRLYGIVDPSRSHEELHLFVDSLIGNGFCRDVHPERDYYGFIPQRETPQPTER